MIKDIKVQNENTRPNDGVLRKLHAIFPQCFTKEGKFDLESFQQLIENEVDITNEGYELNFLGKNYANLIACTETETVIEPDLEHNAQPENVNSQNVYISGDNLDALKHLLKSYSGSIKCIYIDPPYNTGSDDFVYNDKFNFTAEQLQTKLSISEEKANRILDLTTKGRSSHSAWLMFMAPRLLLAKDLLKKDGVIFISIDDNEQANLKLLCDSVFGEENFFSSVIIRANSRGQTYKQIAKTHEYVLVYTRSDLTELFELEKDADSNDLNLMDSKGAFNIRELRNRNPKFGKHNRPKLFFPIFVNPKKIDKDGFSPISLTKHDDYSIEVLPYNSEGRESCWRWSENKCRTNIHDDTLVSNLVAKLKTTNAYGIYEKYRKTTYKPKSIWDDNCFLTETGTVEIKQLGFNGEFDFPKPISLIERCIELSTEEDDIVLDFFSGSATSAHAVMKLNTEDEINRKYIMVQLPEQTPNDSEARKAGFETIDQIGQERIRRAAAKIKENKPDYKGDLGFKHYTLQDVPQNTLDKMETFNPNGLYGEEDILEKFGKETVLETWFVKDGYGFGANRTKLELANYTAYHCGSHLYFVSGEDFDENTVIALIDRYHGDPTFNPQNIVLFGYIFSYTQVEMLKKNLKTLEDSAKNLKINLDIRY